MVEYAVGLLIISNIGTIFSVIYFGGKCIWFFSALKAQVDKHEEQLSKLELKRSY